MLALVQNSRAVSGRPSRLNPVVLDRSMLGDVVRRAAGVRAAAGVGQVLRLDNKRLGDTARIAQQAVSSGGSVASIVLSPGVSMALFGATAPAWAVPVVGAAVVGISLAIQAIANSGCGQTCVITTDYVNKLEPVLQQNLAAYQNGPHTRASQTAALQNFDAGWAWLSSGQGCGNPALGNAGKDCLKDRAAGSCKWRGSDGACWNWFIAYRDPIANDPNVIDTPESTQALTDAAASVVSSLGSAVGSVPTSALLLVGAALLVAAVVD